MDDRDLLSEIKELRRSIEAGVIVLTAQMMHTQHPNKGLFDCQANAIHLMQDTLDRFRSEV
jgi:hypothetical protein